jgi:hypothetical protein
MCYVFLQAQTFALRGGPSSVGGEKVFGFYSGVMVDRSVPSTDVGLFLLSAGSGGASNGQFVIFSQSSAVTTTSPTGVTTITTTGSSNAYQGTITGLSDTSQGGTGTFIGIFTGQAVVQSPTTTQSVSGQMTVKASKGTGRGTSQRLIGLATARTISVQNNVIIVTSGGTTNVTVGPLKTFDIDGWQSTSASSTSGFALSGG